jgi:hypothetical protein
MRVEPAPRVFRNEDRRNRSSQRHGSFQDRRAAPQQPDRRARHTGHTLHVWFEPAFGAHILGQIIPERVVPARARRAYTQPETRTPLRPSIVQSA